ncbi:pyridoxamine 5'-phosphate oxidase family protein [Micromonospora sp. NPDC051196]|uniref:pyridoxamine 5'-phosphate oxidase family protein n=1 Tax=Micromonospora sp. NPDC051196 TaxID=3155281 RepID=UPI0034347E12
MSLAAELTAVARKVIDANLYMTLGTADQDGRPWVSPVYFVASPGLGEFYWASTTQTRHSRNLAVRPELSIVIFDSQVPVYQGRAVYLTAVGQELSGAELDDGLAVYNGPAAVRGVSLVERADLEAPAAYRLYRAVVRRPYTLDPSGHDLRVPVDL